MSVIEDSKKATLESTAKMIASSAEKQKVQNTVLGKNDVITCESVAKLNDVDYTDCSIEFDGNTAKVTIIGSGKFNGLYVCDGTKTSAEASDEECPIPGSIYITELLAQESTMHNGLIKDDTIDENIRYAGSIEDVKNKVYFNCAETDGENEYGSENYNYESSCEIWRIIGVFDTYSSDSETEEAVPRVKLVRDEVLSTSMAWDTSADVAVNQWGETTLASDNATTYPGASLKQYLNDGEGSYYNSLSSIAKGQISNALWYTGAVTADTASGVYEDERSAATGTGTTVNYTTRWLGKIGLIYVSDLGYAGTNCGDYTVNNYENESSCGKSNWLKGIGGFYWTISPVASQYDMSWDVKTTGDAGTYYVPYDLYVRPALYLSPNVKIIDGNGNDEPYILK